jgi:hypothetical protein
MSQLTLTPEEDQIVADALRTKAAQYTAMYGVTDPALESLLAKVTGQLPQPEPVVEEPVNEPTAEEVEAHFAAEEKPAKAKKAK